MKILLIAALLAATQAHAKCEYVKKVSVYGGPTDHYLCDRPTLQEVAKEATDTHRTNQEKRTRDANQRRIDELVKKHKELRRRGIIR